MKNFLAIKYAIVQRAKHHENYSLNRIQRWFYTFKAIICILLKLKKQFTWKDDVVDCVATWNFTTYPYGYSGTEYSWTQLDVGYGYFKNWRYNISQEGT